MRDRIDARSPVPLYWQVAEALRYQVATGELTPGARLPSLREAAAAWGINMHTVRRAYGELAELGIVDVRPRSCTVVLERPDGWGGSGLAPASHPSDGARGGNASRRDAGSTPGLPTETAGLEAWLRDIARRGRERWGLGPGELGAALADLPRAAPAGEPVYVVECSESQAADLARQLGDRWRVSAEPWSLGRESEPPEDGFLVGTYFHYNDIRVRWPRHLPRVRFVATRPDPAVRERLEALRGEREEPLCVTLWERDETMGRNIAADLLRLLPEERFAVRHRVGAPGAVPDSPGGAVLFSPRTWAELPEGARRRGGFIEVRYVFEPGDLDGVARELGWEPRLESRPEPGAEPR